MDNIRDSMRKNGNLVENLGRQFVLKELTQPGDPIQSIVTVQKCVSLTSKKLIPPLLLLDLFKVTRLSIHTNILENLKESLLVLLNDMDTNSLLLLLRETIQFVTIRDLKSIPIAIVKKLGPAVPYKYLDFLHQKNLLMEFPLDIRRQAWIRHRQHFIQIIIDICNQVDSNRTAISVSTSISEMIGNCGELLDFFQDLCLQMFISGDQQIDLTTRSDHPNSFWSTLLLEVCIIQKRQHHSQKLKNRMYDLVTLVDKCRREQKAGSGDILSLANIIRSLILSQASALIKKDISTRRPMDLLSEETTSNKRKIPAVDHHHSDNKANARKKHKSRQQFDEALRILRKLDKGNVFAKKVTDDIAPNYSLVIAHPMCLDAISDKVSAGQYGEDILELNSDVQTMLSNCILYNGKDSYFGEIACAFRSKWNRQMSVFVGSEVEFDDGHDTTDTSTSNTLNNIDLSIRKIVQQFDNQTLGFKEQLRRCLNITLDYLQSLDVYSVFANPVSDSAVPGYSAVIKHKMSFSDIRKKIANNSYSTITQFDNDIALIYNNCFLFNKGNYEFIQIGEQLRDGWQSLQKELLEKIPCLSPSSKPEQQQQQIRSEVAKPSSSDNNQRGTTSISATTGAAAEEECLLGIEFHKHGGDVVKIPRILTVEQIEQRVNGLEGRAALQAAMLLLLEYANEVDTSDFFSLPVQTEGYLATIDTPMDLSTVRKRLDRQTYRSIQQLEDDLLLICSNCFQFNEDFSGVYKAAEIMRYGVILSVKNIKSVLEHGGIGGVILNAKHATSAAVVDRLLEERKECDSIMISDAAICTANNSKLHSPDRSVTETHSSPHPQESIRDDSQQTLVHSTIENSEGDSASEPACQVVGPSLDKKPSFSQLLQSSTSAASILQESEETVLRAAAAVELPTVLLDSTMSWALLIVREPVFQNLLCDVLGRRLHEIMRAAIQGHSKARLAESSTVSTPCSIVFPSQDPLVRLTCQLCQVSLLHFDYCLHSLDDKLIRDYIPKLLHSISTYAASIAPKVLLSKDINTIKEIVSEVINEQQQQDCACYENFFDFLVSLTRAYLSA